MPSSSEFNDMLNAAITGCGVASVAILFAGFLGFGFVLSQGKTIWRSMQFAAFIVMLGLLVPAIFGVATYVAYGSTTAFMANAEKADGVVIRLAETRMSEGGFGYAAVIEYTTAAGRKIEFRDTSEVCNPPCKKVGERVKVLYNADDPTDARVDSLVSNWIWTGVLGLLTIVFLLIMLGVIWHAYRHDKYSLIFEELLDLV